jgi:hypothetical protein
MSAYRTRTRRTRRTATTSCTGCSPPARRAEPCPRIRRAAGERPRSTPARGLRPHRRRPDSLQPPPRHEISRLPSWWATTLSPSITCADPDLQTQRSPRRISVEGLHHKEREPEVPKVEGGAAQVLVLGALDPESLCGGTRCCIPTVCHIGRWAANPVQRSELCRTLHVDFAEHPFHALR